MQETCRTVQTQSSRVNASPCQRQKPQWRTGSVVIVITSLLLHHVGWAWHTVARCEKHKSIARMQEYVTVPSQSTCHFRFRRSHNLRMTIMTHAGVQNAPSQQSRWQQLRLEAACIAELPQRSGFRFLNLLLMPGYKQQGAHCVPASPAEVNLFVTREELFSEVSLTRQWLFIHSPRKSKKTSL